MPILMTEYLGGKKILSFLKEKMNGRHRQLSVPQINQLNSVNFDRKK